jgi:hypothetical protein
MNHVSVASLMSENHRAYRKDGRTDPNDNGGFLLGCDWRRFHDQSNRSGILKVPTRPRTVCSMTWRSLPPARNLGPATVHASCRTNESACAILLTLREHYRHLTTDRLQRCISRTTPVKRSIKSLTQRFSVSTASAFAFICSSSVNRIGNGGAIFS